MKTCFKCRKPKPLSYFYVHSGMRDGHLNKCKECQKADMKALDKVQIRIRDAKRNQRRKAKHNQYNAKYRQEHPEQGRAHATVCRALLKGTLVKQPCEVCGDPNVEAHHEDYTKPLEVRWLCFKHHRYQHGQFQEIAIQGE